MGEEAALEFYRSSTANRASDSAVLGILLGAGIYPDTVRYGAIKDAVRIVAKGLDGELYYVAKSGTHAPKVVKATDDNGRSELERLGLTFKSLLSLDRDAAAKAVDDADQAPQELDSPPVPETTQEEEEKAMDGSGPPVSVSEEVSVQQQGDLQTERHPGAVGSTTPDDPSVGLDWHGDQSSKAGIEGVWNLDAITKSLRASGEQLRDAVPQPPARIPSETRFLAEQGRPAAKALTPAERVRYVEDRIDTLKSGAQRLRDAARRFGHEG